MSDSLREALTEFKKDKSFYGKGPLCVALVVTQHARKKLPLDPEELVTEGGGQVLGLGRGAVQHILARHGITRLLASEGGRTSRGSLNNMREYVAFLNALRKNRPVDLDAIEAFWIEGVNEFFAAKPFKIKMDAFRSLRAIVRDVLVQAEERQKAGSGVYYAGAVLQHLVGAKLESALGAGIIEHNSFSTADLPGGRAGDFKIEDVAIHVTTSPGEGVIERCRDNLNEGLKPIVVTLHKGVAVAEALAENKGIGERIDVFETEQFIALNMYEMGRFAAQGRRMAVSDLVERYNRIIEGVETDPGLKLECK
jgi:hypothetical protein